MKTKNALQCWVIVSTFIVVGPWVLSICLYISYFLLKINGASYAEIVSVFILRIIQANLNLQCYSQRLSSLCFCCINTFCVNTAKLICSFLAIVDQRGGHTKQQRGLLQHYWPASPVAWGGGVLCHKGCPYVSIVVRAPHVFLCDHINQRVCFHIENLKSANQLCCEVKQCYYSSMNLIITILRMSLIQLMGPCVLNNCIVIFRCR